MLDRAKSRPTDNLDPVEEVFHRLALSALQNSNRFADFQSRAEWIFDRIRSHGNRADLEYLRNELRTFFLAFGELQRQIGDLETRLNRAASRRIKE